ncbi:MAG TPA: HI0074 family nucleotidyltransferase substrate-binding subunit [Burkholderiaceae bacterium]|nr:HI0074 family nucleotidyltransferase substrate-binding subunit [Burkholderiaceae bacterium]
MSQPDHDKQARFLQQWAYFNQAMARLTESLAEPESSFMRDSVVKRFEFTFEMAWKAMYRFLLLKGERMAPKAWDVLPVALESLLIEDARLWDQMREYRNDTSHEYDENKVIEVVAFVRHKAYAELQAFAQRMARRVEALQ